MDNSATRARVCFAKAEELFLLGDSPTATSCYLEGLRILLQESQGIRPLEYLELAFREQFVLLEYIVPKASECFPSSLLS